MGIGASSPTAMDHVTKLDTNLTGKTALVTGCTSGMGIEIARALASAGCTVFITGRDSTRLSSVKEQLDAFVKERGSAGRVQAISCDQSSLASVRTAAAEFLRRSTQLHLLVCNAGIMAVPYSLSADGVDLQMAVNHLAHQLLFTLLQPAMLASAPARVVVVSSNAAYQWGPPRIEYERLPAVSAKLYNRLLAYAQSKLANILFAQHINAQYGAQGITAYSLHPGVLRTGLQVNSRLFTVVMTLASPFLKSVGQGASTAVYCAVAPGVEKNSGLYFADNKVTDVVQKQAITAEHADKFWDWCKQFIQQHPS